MTAFDRLLGLRALGFTALATSVALGIILLTDEPLSTAGMRVARLCAFLPALAAVGSAAALAQARSRGELSALQAIGAAPWRVATGAILAAWLVGGIAVVLLSSSLADLSSLFPAVSAAAPWVSSEAALVEPIHGIRVLADGKLGFVPPSAAPGVVFLPSGAAATCAIAPLSLCLPVWVSAPAQTWLRFAAAAATLGLLIVLLHAVAALRLNFPWLVLATLPIALQALFAHWRSV